MANIIPSLKGWSVTEASNQPDSTDSATIAGDLRAIQAGVREIYSQNTIASAATTDLGSLDEGSLTISGTTTITALGTVSAGIIKKVVFSGILTLTHNATSLILPGAANITTAANDRAEMESLGSGNWRCNHYTRASGQPVTSPLSDGDKGDITVSSSGTVWSIDDDVIDAATLGDSALGFSMVNGTLTATVAASALTIAIKTKAGTDPSATDPVLVLFRNATAGTGDYTVISITAATSLVISSGSTMGTISAILNRLWIVGFNDAGTFRIGAINLSTFVEIGDDVIASSTAEGGAGAADSAGVYYTGTAVTSKAMRVLGYVESTQATAGTWATSPSKVQIVSAIFNTKPPRLISGTSIATTSGTSHDFTVPTWVSRITISLSAVSTDSASFPMIQIGDSGGIETSGYSGCTQRGTNFTAYSAGFSIDNGASAANAVRGSMTLSLVDSTLNTWACSGTFGLTGVTFTSIVGGDKSLSSGITTVRLTSVSGTANFDAGVANILYE